MGLVAMLEREATKRSLWPPRDAADRLLAPPDAFYLVRDMAYGRASSRDPFTTIREWRGTCSGKHYLLRVLFAELGLRADLMACTTRITGENAVYLPPALRELLNAGPIIDIHNYLILHPPHGAMVVDATWPLHMKALGVTVNEEFVWGRDMTIACEPLVTQVVLDHGDPQQFKEDLLRKSADARELARRDAFIAAMDKYGES